MSEQVFEKRQLPFPDLSNERIFHGRILVKALFEPECKWRLVEEYGMDSFMVQPDGRLLFSFEFVDLDSILYWILSFGNLVDLLEPKEVRSMLGKIGEEFLKKYKDT